MNKYFTYDEIIAKIRSLRVESINDGRDEYSEGYREGLIDLEKWLREEAEWK